MQLYAAESECTGTRETIKTQKDIKKGFFLLLLRVRSFIMSQRGKKEKSASQPDSRAHDIDEANQTFKNIVVSKYLPHHLNPPRTAKALKRKKFEAREAEFNSEVASIRAANEIGNLHLAQCKFYQHVLPLAMMHHIDAIDRVADSLANLRANVPRANHFVKK